MTIALAKADPITAEIIRSARPQTSLMMKTNLMRTAYNLITYEMLDFTVGFVRC